MSSSSSSSSGACLKCCLVVFAVASALCVSGPALYWRFSKGFGGDRYISSSSSSCEPCFCDCPPPLSLHKIAPGLVNLSVADCGKNEPELNKEMGKQFVDLLTEELKLQETVAEEHSHHMNATLVEAKRMASQYQKEVEKCNAATETCEVARERNEAFLAKEKKITAMWERRARQLGWHAEYFLQGSEPSKTGFNGVIWIHGVGSLLSDLSSSMVVVSIGYGTVLLIC